MPNLRLALRTLFKSPFVTLVAILSLALGIGANSAIFSLFDQMLLRPLPVPRAGELINFKSPGPKPGSTSCSQAGGCDEIFSYPMFRDLERAQASFTGIAAHRNFGGSLGYQGTSLSGEGLLVSGSYFPVLALTPAMGRLFTPEDDKTVGTHFGVVLSHAYWNSRFALHPNVLNEALVVNGQAMTIVGVAPRGFNGTVLGNNLVMRQVVRMAVVGGVVGMAIAIGVGRLAKSMLFEMEGHDPLVLTAATFALALVALGAGFIPALRASRTDPMTALRYE